jgi:hypothetical protein
MDITHFDHITRRLTVLPSRRVLLRGLAAAGFGLAATRLPARVAAKKKHSKTIRRRGTSTSSARRRWNLVSASMRSSAKTTPSATPWPESAAHSLGNAMSSDLSCASSMRFLEFRERSGRHGGDR